MSQGKSKIDLFVDEYILTGCKNATEAAIKAGYSEKTAASQGSRLLKDVKVVNKIKERKKIETKLFIKTKEEKLIWLEKIALNGMEIIDPEKGMVNPASSIAAIKEHNVMQGDNAPVETVSNVVVTESLAERLTNGSKR